MRDEKRYITYFDCCAVAVETDKDEGPTEECPGCGGEPRESVLTAEE